MRAMLILSMVALAGCASTVETPRRDYRATVTGRGDTPNARAAVHAVSLDGRTDVEINFAGGTSGATHPWHIHSGTCATGGGVVGGGQSYTPLRPDASGNATSQAVLPTELTAGESYHVNVHRSPQAMGEIISCGDLTG